MISTNPKGSSRYNSSQMGFGRSLVQLLGLCMSEIQPKPLFAGNIPSLKLTSRLVSFWNGLFSEANLPLVSGGKLLPSFQLKKILEEPKFDEGIYPFQG